MSTTTVLVETTNREAEQAHIELQPIQHDAVLSVPVTHHQSVLDKKNSIKLAAAGLSFFFAGTNDGSLGTLTPYVLRTYSIGTEHVALM
jgi:hypothetical protein